MRLSNIQRKELELALLDAFPDKASLERMVSHELEKNLNEIASDGSLQDITFKLIKKAEAEGWIENLISAAVQSNPRNPSLQTIAQKLSSPSVARLAQIDNLLLNTMNYQLKGILINLAVLSIGIGIGISIWEYTHYQDTLKNTLKGEKITQTEMEDLCNNEEYYKEIIAQIPGVEKKYAANLNKDSFESIKLTYDPYGSSDSYITLKDVIPAYRWRCVYQLKSNAKLKDGGSHPIIIGLNMDKFICEKKYKGKSFIKSAYLHYDKQNSFYCIFTPPDK